MADLRWLPDVPAEVRAAAEPSLLRWQALVPGWCYEIHIEWADDPEQGEDAHMGVSWEYRHARVTLCPGWLSHPPEERDTLIGHEYLHIALGPMTNWVRGVLEAHVQDESLRGQLIEEWRQRFEGATSDFTHCLRPLVPVLEPVPLRVV